MPLKGKGNIGDLQREILLTLSSLPDVQHFYLSGGTALAEFYFGHRKSYDLDIFSWEQNLILPWSRIVEETLVKQYIVALIRRFETFVEFEVKFKGESTRLQLAYDSPARFEKPIASDAGMLINDYRDIITDKLLAFFGRAEPRDAVDLFFILQREDFWKLAKLAGQKDPGFDLYWCAAALERTQEFPDEIERWPVEMIVPLDPVRLKSDFKALANEVMKKINTSYDYNEGS